MSESDSVVRNCDTCAHRKDALCVLGGFLCKTMRQYPGGVCDLKLSGWTKRPARKSLLRAVYDLLFAWEQK